MKTNYFSQKMAFRFLQLLFVPMVLISCGSYKNSSYYDRDGIYGNDDRQVSSNNSQNSNQYKDYFSSRIDQNDTLTSFTDVDKYDNANNNQNSNAQSYSTGNAGWGSNAGNVTVNVYDNSFGWNTGWYYGGYSPYWGWNSWALCGEITWKR